MGIPTIRREGADYLTQTVTSLIEGMSPEEQNMCLIIVFVAEVIHNISYSFFCRLDIVCTNIGQEQRFLIVCQIEKSCSCQPFW